LSSRPTNFKPQRRSSLYHKQTSLGAKFVEDKEGWLRVERFTDPETESKGALNGIAIADISHVVKLSLKDERVLASISGWSPSNEPPVPGAALRPIQLPEDALCVPVASDEALLLVRPSAATPETISSLLNFDRGGFSVTDITSVLAGLYVLGPGSRALLSKLTEVNVNPDSLPNLASKQVGIRNVHCLILRSDLAVPGYQLYFDRSYGEYFWDAVSSAGKSSGLTFLGLSALKLLGWTWE
jgi:glycine cleavage system aminomethyltransferase T